MALCQSSRMAATGPERLAEYRDRSTLKQYELAERLGIHEAYLSQLLSGARRPSRELSLRIEDQTGIPVRSWSDNSHGGSAGRSRKRTLKVRLRNKIRSASAG